MSRSFTDKTVGWSVSVQERSYRTRSRDLGERICTPVNPTIIYGRSTSNGWRRGFWTLQKMCKTEILSLCSTLLHILRLRLLEHYVQKSPRNFAILRCSTKIFFRTSSSVSDKQFYLSKIFVGMFPPSRIKCRKRIENVYYGFYFKILN